jgi:hypothetical protein
MATLDNIDKIAENDHGVNAGFYIFSLQYFNMKLIPLNLLFIIFPKVQTALQSDIPLLKIIKMTLV